MARAEILPFFVGTGLSTAKTTAEPTCAEKVTSPPAAFAASDAAAFFSAEVTAGGVTVGACDGVPGDWLGESVGDWLGEFDGGESDGGVGGSGVGATVVKADELVDVAPVFVTETV
jgi:hypothetical protein